jgi:serine/threonine-protein kinase
VQPHASAAPSAVPSRPSETSIILPANPYKTPAPAVQPNPYDPDTADLAPPPRSTPSSPPTSPKTPPPGSPASTTAPNRRANCTPPYVVDANGKLLWKEECLTNSKTSPHADSATSERR